MSNFDKPTLSIVHYLNALPLSWGFIHGDQQSVFRLDFSPPSRCADLLLRGEVDVGLIPAIEYQRIENLRVVPNLAVASKNAVKSVLLISKLPVKQIRTVATDSSSRTSVCLLKILFQAYFKTEATFTIEPPNVNRMLEKADATLVIGDLALKTGIDGLYRYDLGQEWRRFTGKPFVFAFWGVRETSSGFDSWVFEKSFQFGVSRLEEIVLDQSRSLGLSPSVIRSYITENIDYSLDSENLDGLQTFFELAREYHLIDSLRKVEFL